MKALLESKWLYVTAFIFTFVGAMLDSALDRFVNKDSSDEILQSAAIPNKINADTIVVTFNSQTKSFELSKKWFKGNFVCFITDHTMGDVRYSIYVAGRAERLLHEMLVREKDIGAWFEIRYKKSVHKYAVHLMAQDLRGRTITTRIVIDHLD